MKTIKQVILDLVPIIDKRMKNPGEISGIPTGHKKLDMMIDGLQPEFYIVGGRTSMGKSAFVKGIIKSVAQAGYANHIVNIEDANTNTVLRMLAEEMNIPFWVIKRGLLKPYEYEKFLRTAGEMTELPITFDDTVSKASAVRDSMKTAIFEGAKLITVDYLQLISPDTPSGRKRQQDMAEISNMIKTEIVKGCGIPVIAVVQLNRACEQRGADKRPMLCDIRECGDIEQDADVVMFLYREGYYTQDKNDKTAELLIKKGKNSGTGMIEMTFDELTTSYKEKEEYE